MTSSSTSAGICVRTRARFVFTASMTATVFDPVCRRMARVTVGTPSQNAALVAALAAAGGEGAA